VRSREDILARVRRNQPDARPLPQIPPIAAPAPTLARFKAALTRMGGKVADAPENGDVAALIRALHPQAKVIASAVPEVKGNRPLDKVRAPAELDDVDVGVVRAVFGVAETGSVWLPDAALQVNVLGFLAQHLVVLLDPASLVASMHEAYARRAEFEAPYGIFMTGPSATADIEGILIHGAQGVRSLTVVPLAPR
jgi:L-lactate dehydrogenase complex protein LldG